MRNHASQNTFHQETSSPLAAGLVPSATAPEKSEINRKRSRSRPVIVSPIVGTALIAITVVATMFMLAYAWEFWFEAAAMQVFGLPYDDGAEAQDHWRYIATSVGFVSLSLVVPTIIMVRKTRRIERVLSRLE